MLESPKIKSVTVSTVSPSICHEVMGPDAVILVFWVLSCEPALSWLNHLPKAPSLKTITLQHMNLWVRHKPSVHSTYAIKGNRHMLSWVSCHSDWFASSEVFQKKVLDAGSSHHTTLLLTSALSVCCSQSCCCSSTQSCPTLCDPMDCSKPGFNVFHHLLELVQTHVHWVSDAIQPSHPLLSPSPAFNLSQHQGLFQWVSSSHQVPK